MGYSLPFEPIFLDDCLDKGLTCQSSYPSFRYSLSACGCDQIQPLANSGVVEKENAAGHNASTKLLKLLDFGQKTDEAARWITEFGRI